MKDKIVKGCNKGLRKKNMNGEYGKNNNEIEKEEKGSVECGKIQR